MMQLLLLPWLTSQNKTNLKRGAEENNIPVNYKGQAQTSGKEITNTFVVPLIELGENKSALESPQDLSTKGPSRD